MVQVAEGMCQSVQRCVRKAGRPEQNVNLLRRDIVRQRLPHQKHPNTAAMRGIDTGPAQFQQTPARAAQGLQIELGIAVKTPVLPQAGIWQKAVCTDNVITCCGIAILINQDQMIKNRVEHIAFQTLCMIDQRTVPAHLLHKDAVAQALGGTQITRIARKTHGQTVTAAHCCASAQSIA